MFDPRPFLSLAAVTYVESNKNSLAAFVFFVSYNKEANKWKLLTKVI